MPGPLGLNIALFLALIGALALPHRTPPASHDGYLRPATPAERLQHQGDALMDELRQARTDTSPARTDLGVSR